jgi:hypothetical protein
MNECEKRYSSTSGRIHPYRDVCQGNPSSNVGNNEYVHPLSKAEKAQTLA